MRSFSVPLPGKILLYDENSPPDSLFLEARFPYSFNMSTGKEEEFKGKRDICAALVKYRIGGILDTFIDLI